MTMAVDRQVAAGGSVPARAQGKQQPATQGYHEHHSGFDCVAASRAVG